MNNRHILIISFHYPPSSEIGARRISKISKLLYEKGWIPHIITAIIPAPDFPSEIEIPLELIKHIEWPDIWNTIERIKIGPLGRSLSRVLKRLTYPSANILEIRLNSWINKAFKEGIKVIEENKIELIYSSFSPSASIRIASRLNRKTGIPWINEYRDLWTLHPYSTRNKLLKMVHNKIEKRLIADVSALVTVSEPKKNDLISLHGKHTYVVYNAYDSLDNNYSTARSKLIILYSGSYYKKKWTPEPLFKALQILKKEKYKYLDKLEVKFYGHRIPEYLNQLVNKYELDDIVRLFNPVSHKEIVQIQKESSILLLLGWNNPKDAGVLAAKLFEYIGRNKVILGITYPYGEVNKILEETGLGKVIIDENEIAKFIEDRMRDFLKGNVNLGFQFNEKEIRKYSREQQVQNLIEIFEKTINSKSVELT